MRITLPRLAASLCLLSISLACPAPPMECIDGTEEVCDLGGLPPDFCNSPQEALADTTNCHLNVTTGGPANRAPKKEVFISRLEDGGVDQDWYFAQAPGGLTARSLLHVSGGYTAPQSAVNFSVNVLEEGPDGGLLSVFTAIDKHGAAAPKPIDVILPFGNSNARLFVLVSDEGAGGQRKVDNRNPYSLFMEVSDNPDVNEPNDSTPTPIALAGTPLTGTGSGYLATNDDVDTFSFQVGGTGRQIIYLHILGPAVDAANPAPPYRLSYTLFDPTDRPIAEGVMANEFLRIDLATARLAPMTGTYKLDVRGFKPPNSTLPVKGALWLQYNVELQLLSDLDTQEGSGGNDTTATARRLNLAANGSQSVTGKLSYVADEEWFVVNLPARATPSVLRYRIITTTAGGRFSPLSGTPARQVRVLKAVTTGATEQDRQVACRTNSVVCPKSDSADLFPVNELCNGRAPLCLYAQRNEERPGVDDLRNLSGAIPVLPNQATEFLIVFKDEGVGSSKYADDRDWTLEVEWLDDADEAARPSGPTVMGLSGTTAVAVGELTYGYGEVLNAGRYFGDSDSTGNPQRLRGRNDYDAYTTDTDLFQFSFGAAMGVQGWELSWELLHPPDGGAPPGDLAFDFSFCGTPSPDGGACVGNDRLIFGYNGANLTPWYLPRSQTNATMLFTKTSTATSTTISVAPVACGCFSGTRTAAGSFFANLSAVERTSNDPLRYRVSQRLSPYPVGACPADGGCGFVRP